MCGGGGGGGGRLFVRERAGVCMCVVLFILFHSGFFV